MPWGRGSREAPLAGHCSGGSYLRLATDGGPFCVCWTHAPAAQRRAGAGEGPSRWTECGVPAPRFPAVSRHRESHPGATAARTMGSGSAGRPGTGLALCARAHTNEATARTPAAGRHALGACSSQLPCASGEQSPEKSSTPLCAAPSGGIRPIHRIKVPEDFMSTHASPRGANDHDTRGADGNR